MRKRLAIAVCLALCSLVTAAQAREALREAPNFILPGMNDTNLRLNEFRGRPVMLNFWASWCGPCRVEMPQLEKIYQQFEPDGLQVLGISIDEDPDNAREKLDNMNLSFPVLFDLKQRIAGVYGVARMPTTVFIDAAGNVHHVHKGFRKGDEKIYTTIVQGLLKP